MLLGAPIGGALADHTPAPHAPASLEAAAGDKAVGLTWSHSPATDRAGYRIYRSTSLPVPTSGSPINGSLITGQTHIDKSRTNGTTYHYAVVAVDTDGNASPASPTASARPAAPATPTGDPLSWMQKASSAIARAEAGGVAAGGKLYVFGGQFTGVTQTARSDKYDAATDTWTQIANLPELITHAPVVADGDTLWILGGYVGSTKKDSTNKVWKYNTTTNTYSPGPALPAARGGGGGILVGRELHYLSGAVRSDSTGAPTTDFPEHWVLNVDSGTSWTTSTPVPNPRNHVATVHLNGKIYLIGGQHGEFESSTPQKQVDIFDLATSTWSRAADLPVPRGHVSASTFVHDGKILVLGGSVLGAAASGTFYQYDPATDAWTTRTNLAEAVRSPVADLIDGTIVVSGGRAAAGPSVKTFTTALGGGTQPPANAGSWAAGPALPDSVLDASAAAIAGKVYVVGGKNSTGPVSTLSIFDTATQQWSAGAPLPGAAVENPAVVAVDGQLYAIGGSTTAFDGSVATTYRYDPAGNAWTPLASSGTPRGGAGAAVIGQTIWLTGGMNGGASLNTTEKYDIATNTWSPGPNLATARDNHGAAAVNGTLYVFGGRTRLANGTEVTANIATTESLASAGAQWVARAGMPNGRRAMATGVIGTKIIAAGGERQANGATFPQTEEYDPATNTWRTLAPMTTPRHGAASAVVAGKLHSIGGGPASGASYSTTHEIFTPSGAPPVEPPTYSLRYSTATNRSASVSLNGASVSGNIYAFTTPDTGATQVRFYLDDPTMSGTPRRTDTAAPFDFVGGTATAATAFDTTTVPNGSHTITAAVVTATGTSVLNSTFTVNNTPAPSGFSLRYSTAANRSAPADLAGATVSGNLFAFTTPDTGVTQVRFYLDNPSMSGTPRRTESGAPFDFNGGTAAAAIAFDTTTLTNGSHTITAAVVTSAGTTVLNAPFTVDNTGTPPVNPTYALRYSTATNRSAPTDLNGATVSGNIYPFTTPDTGVTQVRFYLDDQPMAGAPRTTDTAAPFDFVGGTATAATAFDTKTISNGTHTITAAVVNASGTTVLNSTFTVNNAPAPAGFALRYSTAANRAAPADLAGATVSGNIYAFTTPDTGVTQVRFYIDNPSMSGTPFRSESGAPFDLNGGTAAAAIAYDTTSLTNGSHTITAAVVTSAGTTVLNAPITVANSNQPPDPPDPTGYVRKIDFGTSNNPLATGYLRDYGQSYAARTSGSQGTGNTYGWIDPETGSPLDLTRNGRDRTATTVTTDLRMETLMHMQYEGATTTGTPVPGTWEIELPNGFYDVTLGVGDAGAFYNSSHHVNVENQNAIAALVPTSGNRLGIASRTVFVEDGRLSLSATGGQNTKITFVDITGVQNPSPARPRVTTASPSNSITDVLADTGVTTELSLPNGGLQGSTVNSSTVRLTRASDGVAVAANVNTSGGGDVIALTPAAPLAAGTWYRFEVTTGVQDVTGQPIMPWSHVFKTGGESGGGGLTGVAFDKFATAATNKMFTSLVVGPDHRLYAGTIDGVIMRYPINADGTLGAGFTINTIKARAGGGMRTIIGMAFDPASTAAAPILWVTDNAPYLGVDDVPDWEGKIVRLSGPDLSVAQDRVVNLPRSNRDHESNSLAFGPDGALYMTQGSNTAMGAPDAAWGNRPERMLSAAVVRVDVAALPATALDVKTEEGGTYDPLAAGAPVTIYASGVRNAYDLVWHSNGELYVPTNGSAAGGHMPASPAPLPASCANRIDAATNGAYTGPVAPGVTGNPEAESDFVFRVHQGGYYGHPAPVRCEWVLNGGDPTSAKDDFEVKAYPDGTQPDRNYRVADVYDMGLHASADGAIEYKSNTFGGALKGRLLVVRYSVGDDIVALDTSGAEGGIAGRNTGIPGMTGFNDPLDLTEDTVNGNIYVSELGGNKITLLRPRVA